MGIELRKQHVVHIVHAYIFIYTLLILHSVIIWAFVLVNPSWIFLWLRISELCTLNGLLFPQLSTISGPWIAGDRRAT